ncbi:MAG: hypothetical protein GY798_15010 [Hyphomicrobiales bacterium]|nr:hypothetical protein [Hyphomicrobiales bacterium]
MRVSARMAREAFVRLRRRIAEIEGRPSELSTAEMPVEPTGMPVAHLSPQRGGACLPFGVADLDQLLAGGLRRNALHEIRTEATRDSGIACGFAAAILSRLGIDDDRPMLWVVEEAAGREGGFVHGPGLERFGLAAHRLVLVRVRHAREALWVFEEGLRCSGLAAVLAEIRGHPTVLDLTAGRRLALRARDSGVMGLLMRQSAGVEPGASTTRWLVTPQPAAVLDDFAAGIGQPVWRLHLERNRAGATGQFDLEWDHGIRSFASARPETPALPRNRTSLSAERSHPAHAAGTVVAMRRAG